MFAEFDEQLGIREPTGELKNASAWMIEPEIAPDQILNGVLDRGDKLVIIGSSKSRKTFFTLQMILSIAAGKKFLKWDVPEPRTVLHIQYEIQPHHFHKRLIRMCRAMSVKPADLADRLQILNARGMGLTGEKAIENIRRVAETVKPALISIDPLYKLLDGDENSNGRDGMKGTLAMFDRLAEDVGAAVSYVHHDAKGSPGDKINIDRGAGGGILARDFDSSIILTPHASEDDAFVVETVLRNYPPESPATIQWGESDNGGYCFESRPLVTATKRTSKTRTPVISLDTYRPVAEFILKGGEIEVALFKEKFKKTAGVGDNRVRDFITWACAGEKPLLRSREERKMGVHKKWLSLSTSAFAV